METRLEVIDVNVPCEELAAFAQQRQSFSDMSRLCAGTIQYEYEVQQILKLVPDEGKIRSFASKEEVRLKDQPEALAKVLENLPKKIKSRDAILTQVSGQVVAAKEFRKKILDTFAELERSSSICQSIWGSLISGKFSDQIISSVLANQVVTIKAELKALEGVCANEVMLNTDAIDAIAENVKAIADGGSEELKKAMVAFNDVTARLTEHGALIATETSKHNDVVFQLDRQISAINRELQHQSDSEQGLDGQAQKLRAECQALITSTAKEANALEAAQKIERGTSETNLTRDMAAALAAEKVVWEGLQSQSKAAQEAHHGAAVAQAEENNKKLDQDMKDHEKRLKNRLAVLQAELKEPQRIEASSYEGQIRAAHRTLREGQDMAGTTDEYTWFEVSSGWGPFRRTSDERRLTKGHAQTRAQGNTLIQEANAALLRITEAQAAEKKTAAERYTQHKAQIQREIDSTTAQIPAVRALYPKESIPAAPKFDEAKATNFESSATYNSLDSSWQQKRTRDTAIITQRQEGDKEVMRQKIAGLNIGMEQKAIAFLEKFKFVTACKTVAEAEAQLGEVVDKQSPKQQEDAKFVSERTEARVALEAKKVHVATAWAATKAGLDSTMKAIEEQAAIAVNKLEVYKDDSPVSLDSLYKIYSVMGNIRSRQNNADNMKELLPSVIKQFLGCCGNMLLDLNNLGQVEVKSAADAEAELTVAIGAHFTAQKKSAALFQKWVDEIVDGDEEYLPIVQNLEKHAKLVNFTRFKAICADEGARKDFLAKVAKAKASDTVPKLDEEQLDNLSEILQTLSDNVKVWEKDYMQERIPILMYEPRYQTARNFFFEVVKQIRFMPNTRQIVAEIVDAIKIQEEEGKAELEKLKAEPDGGAGQQMIQN